MPKLLLAQQQKGWPHVQRLLLALLRFLEPYLRNADLTEAVRMLYKVRSSHDDTILAVVGRVEMLLQTYLVRCMC